MAVDTPLTMASKASKATSSLLAKVLPSSTKHKTDTAPLGTGETNDTTMESPATKKQFISSLPQPPVSGRLVRILVIGAGSRGHAYTEAIEAYNKHPPSSKNYIPGTVVAVAEVDDFKREEFGRRFIWKGKGRTAKENESFSGWKEWVAWERERRERVRLAKEEGRGISEVDVNGEIDAVFICVLDEMHVEVIEGVKELGGVHVMCEKPLATTLDGCVRIWRAVQAEKERGVGDKVFGICHVLRYSPHNGVLRELVRVKDAVGDVISVNHTEPVGWWHFSHSYVRGNWRKESKTAPSLLTKSCHDIDWLLWMLCSPADATSSDPPHLPAYISSTGSVKFFRKQRKPQAAGDATNCLSCPIEKDCMLSARKIYLERHLAKGDAGWPVKIVNPEIESYYLADGLSKAAPMLLEKLEEDYTTQTPAAEVEARPWFGRCAWESDNDVCDDQYVTMTWEDDPLPSAADPLQGRTAKSASFHMISMTESICERRGRIYGTKGEIEYDSSTIRLHDFGTGKTETIRPEQVGGGHGGGDSGLARQFILSVDAVLNKGEEAELAQKKRLGCTLEEVIRSHAMVFAAEDARLDRKVVDWASWWQEKVQGQLEHRKDLNGSAHSGTT